MTPGDPVAPWFKTIWFKVAFMSLKIILFGKLADIAGGSVSVDTVADTDSLINALHKDHPGLANTKYVIAENTTLNKNNIIALLPPFSGG